MNKTCVVGASNLVIINGTSALIDGGNNVSLLGGQKVTIDGNTGNVWVGTTVPVITGETLPELIELLSDEGTHLRIVADTKGKVVGKVPKKAYIDISLLTLEEIADLPNKLDNPDDGIDWVISLESGLGKIDDAFTKMFGIQAYSGTAKLEGTLGWSSEVISNCTIVEGSEYVSDKMREVLKQNGFKFKEEVTSFLGLANSTGAVSVSPDIIDKVFGGVEGFNLAKSLLTAHSGKSFTGSVAPQYWFDNLTKLEA
jgi:hypothetical protein